MKKLWIISIIKAKIYLLIFIATFKSCGYSSDKGPSGGLKKYREIKRIWLLINAFFVLSPLNAQQVIDNYRSALEARSSNIPEDQIFIHTDRNLYRPGDTIYFQSYIQDRVLQQCQTISGSIYVLLQNSAHALIDSARFRINSSLAPGYLTIPDTVSPGYYRMVSYTSLMQNYDPHYCHTAWIKVDKFNSKAVNATFSFDKTSYSPNDTAEVLIRLTDQSGKVLKDEDFVYTLVIYDVPGDYYKVRSNGQGESTLSLLISDSIEGNELSIEINLQKRNFVTRKRIPKTIEKPDLRFLPEGGTFTYGIRQRLAFNAVDQDGGQLYISGIIRNNQGEFIDSITSGELGPGFLEFTPINGEKYYAEIQDYPDQQFELPLPSNLMPVLRADPSDQSVIVRVTSPDASSRNDFLVFRKNNKVLAFQEIDSTYQVFRFETRNLPQGTAGFLLLDGNLNPVAERMVFINSDKKVHVNISPAANIYQPGQETEISFSLTDTLSANLGAVFSVAVVDSITAFYPNLLTSNIEECFLFDQQFYNNLPPHVKFRCLSKMNQEDLDILLLTYGWKKFTRQSPAVKNEQAERIYYDMLKLVINDNLVKRDAKKISELRKPFFLLSLEDSRIFDLKRIDNKSYYFLFDSLGQDAHRIMITPADSISGYVTSASVKFPVHKDYYHSVASSTTEPVLDGNNELSIIPDYNFITNRMQFIDEVSITESRKKATEYTNEFEEEYKNFSTITVRKEDIEAAFDFESLLRDLHPVRLDPFNKMIYLRYNPPSLQDPTKLIPALFVLDGIPMQTNYSMLSSSILPGEIHSITALKGPFAFWRYGPKAEGGVVFIETKSKNAGGKYEYKDENPSVDRGDLGKVMNLFRPNIEFYTPDVKNIAEDPHNWVRPTLFWDPELVFDGTKPVKIKYPNHLKKGTVLIKVNGVTEDNRPFFGEYHYEVK